MKEARRTIKKPQVEKFDCIQHKEMFWCYCCEAEVEKNVTDDKMTVLFGGVLEHMATWVTNFNLIDFCSSIQLINLLTFLFEFFDLLVISNVCHFSKEHKKNTHKFWWDNKADMKLKDKVLITDEEIKR